MMASHHVVLDRRTEIVDMCPHGTALRHHHVIVIRVDRMVMMCTVRPNVVDTRSEAMLAIVVLIQGKSVVYITW